MSFRRKQFLELLQDSSLMRLNRKQLHHFSGWLFGTIGVLLMFLWNPRLVIATVTGVGLMILVYVIQGWNWQHYWLKLEQFVTVSQGKLTIAVGSGGLAALGTYIAASVWADSENRWLATGSILQGFGTLLTLLLLLWQIVTNRDKCQETKFDQLLADLTAVEPLKRLIAVRQLTQLVNKKRLQPKYQQQLIEYFYLLLAKEQDGMIREAVLESLHNWQRNPVKTQQNQSPLQIPVNLKHFEKI